MSVIARRLCTILAAVSIAALAGCQTPVAPPPKPAPPPPAPVKTAPHQLSKEESYFLRLPNLAADKTPLRVGIILPVSNPSAATRNLAGAMMKAAELALYDSGSRDILLMTSDESGKPAEAAEAARRLLDQGAEVIVGPLFAGSVTAVAPIARDRGVPVIAFSTDRNVAGDGVYLLSFQPETEVRRVVDYAASQGHKNFAALIPSTAYGKLSEGAFREAVTASGGTISAVEHFSSTANLTEQAGAISKAAPDVLFVPLGGAPLRTVASALKDNGVDTANIKLLGTGLWDDLANGKEDALHNGWFAAPSPEADRSFVVKYREAFGSAPPQLAALAYDAVSLAALIGAGEPYHRFTQTTLTDPNGFSGVDGIFRFKENGTIERGLSVLTVRPGGFEVVSPAPATFEHKGS